MSVRRGSLSCSLSSDRLVQGRFRVLGRRLGLGNFGDVRLGNDERNGDKVAIKIQVEHKDNKGNEDRHGSIEHEYHMLKRLYQGYPRDHQLRGIPRVLGYGKCGRATCLVLDLLGPNLEQLFDLMHRRFSLKTVLMIALQLLDRIEMVHARGIVFRDMKPENVLVGRPLNRRRTGTSVCSRYNAKVLHLVDFGLATPFKDPRSQQHVSAQSQSRTMTGTVRYMSLASHMGNSISRRDDLESILYMLIYFAKGRLPWQGIKGGLKDKFRKIRDAKMNVKSKDLTSGLPKQFQMYFDYVRDLTFSQEPDYEYLKNLMHESFEKQGFDYDQADFDWAKYDVTTINASNKRTGDNECSMLTEEDDELDLNDNHSDDNEDNNSNCERLENKLDEDKLEDDRLESKLDEDKLEDDRLESKLDKEKEESKLAKEESKEVELSLTAMATPCSSCNDVRVINHVATVHVPPPISNSSLRPLNSSSRPRSSTNLNRMLHQTSEQSQGYYSMHSLAKNNLNPDQIVEPDKISESDEEQKRGVNSLLCFRFRSSKR